MDDKGKKFIVGIFEDEDILLDAITSVRDKGVNIYEVYSPFPVHGIENRLGYKVKIIYCSFLLWVFRNLLSSDNDDRYDDY